MKTRTQKSMESLIAVWRQGAVQVRAAADTRKYGETVRTALFVEANTLESCASQLEEALSEVM